MGKMVNLVGPKLFSLEGTPWQKVLWLTSGNLAFGPLPVNSSCHRQLLLIHYFAHIPCPTMLPALISTKVPISGQEVLSDINDLSLHYTSSRRLSRLWPIVLPGLISSVTILPAPLICSLVPSHIFIVRQFLPYNSAYFHQHSTHLSAIILS